MLASEKMDYVLVNEQIAIYDARDVVWKSDIGGDALGADVGGFGEVDDAEV